MKKLRIFYLALIVPMLIFAQSREIKGKVLDEDNNPLPGANISVDGTVQGGATDFDGLFSFSVKGDAKQITISFIGYKNKTIALTVASNYVIKLNLDKNSLDEVIVIGYGSSAKKDLTGAISEIKEEDEVAGQYTSVASLLQGRTSGVSVSSNTGAPGAPVSIRIRGANSLRGNNEPLYVVDGVIINSAGEDVLDATSDANETQQTQNGLTGINPRDIESMVVLKDAAATAIYGSRGANGVILITTKRGKLGKAVINVFASTTITEVNNTIPVLDAVGYAEYRNANATNQGNDVPYFIENRDVYNTDTNGDPIGDPLRQVNWQDEIYKTAFSINAGLNMSGANDTSNYYVSADFNETEGIIPNTFLNFSNLQMNYSNNVTDKLKLDTRVGMYIARGNMAQGASIGGGSRSFTRQLVSYNPLVDGEVEDDPEQSNPFRFLRGFEEKIEEKRLNASINLTYNINDDFKYQMRAGSNYRNKDRSRWYDNDTKKGSFTNGYLALSYLEKISYTFDNLLMYNHKFDNGHRINATVGVTYDGSDAKNAIYEVGGFPISNLREKSPQLGEIVLTPFSTLRFKDNIFSYLGRATYTIKNKYMINASFRADQSSKFSGTNQTGYFPSLSGAWTVSNEKFLKNSNSVSNLKLRASWGQVGNQAINPYQTFNNYGAVFYADPNNSTVLGVSPLNIANKDLTWETTTQTNIGLDLGFWNNRLVASVDVYKKETTDLLINTPTPTSSGFNNFLKNQGGLQNQGLDFSIDGLIVDNEDFTFSLGGNISFNKSEITDLDALPLSDIYIDGELESTPYYLGNNVSTGNNFKAPANAFIQGQEVGLFWGFKTAGIYEDQAAADAGPTVNGNPNLAGDVVFVDLDGDGNVNDSDKTNIGNPNADFTYGINANLAYKNLTLSMLFNGVHGNEILNGNLLIENFADGSSDNIRPDAFYDAWSPTNTTGVFPRVGSITATTVPSDRLVEDGSYFRLNNITLGYDIEMSGKSFINAVKLYASGNNLFTITNYSGFDPELTSFLYEGTIIGVDWVGTPNVSSFVIGANIKF